MSVYLKIGMEFFYAHGAKGYEAVAAEGLPIFLDLKLHDIPNTVAAGMQLPDAAFATPGDHKSSCQLAAWT